MQITGTINSQPAPRHSAEVARGVEAGHTPAVLAGTESLRKTGMAGRAFRQSSDSVARLSPVRSVATAARIEQVVAAERAMNTRTSRLVAGTVPGGVSFAGATPQPEQPVTPFYRHPADQNGAATAMQVGRRLDITG